MPGSIVTTAPAGTGLSQRRPPEARLLVDVDAHAVAEPVLEVVAVPGVCDDLDGEVVNLGSYDARMSGGGACLVRGPHDIVDLALLRARLANNHGARHVGAVVAHAGAVIHKHKIALADRAVARNGVGVGGVGSRGHDGREGETLAAVGEHEVLELCADLLLGESGANELLHMDKARVGHGLRSPHAGDLLGVLHGAERLDVAVEAGEKHGARNVVKRAQELLVKRQLHVVLDGNDAATELCQPLGNPTRDGDGFHVDGPRSALPHALDEAVEVTRVGVEQKLVVRDDRGVGVLVREVKDPCRSGEPAEIGLVANNYGVVAALLHEFAQTRDAPGGTVLPFGHMHQPFKIRGMVLVLPYAQSRHICLRNHVPSFRFKTAVSTTFFLLTPHKESNCCRKI